MAVTEMDAPLATPCNIQICDVTCDSFRIMWDMSPEDGARATHFFIDLSRKESRDPNRFKHRVWQSETAVPPYVPSPLLSLDVSVYAVCVQTPDAQQSTFNIGMVKKFTFRCMLCLNYSREHKWGRETCILLRSSWFNRRMIFCITLDTENRGRALSVLIQSNKKNECSQQLQAAVTHLFISSS